MIDAVQHIHWTTLKQHITNEFNYGVSIISSLKNVAL